MRNGKNTFLPPAGRSMRRYAAMPEIKASSCEVKDFKVVETSQAVKGVEKQVKPPAGRSN